MRHPSCWIALLLGLSVFFSSCGAPRRTAEQEAANPDPVPQEESPESSSEAPAQPPEESPESSSEAPAEPPEGSPESSSEAPAEPPEESSEAQTQTATLYIGRDGQFQEYPVTTSETITPDWLIAQIALLTGWNLELAEPVTTGKGGMSVTFTERSSIVTGPPEPQKEEFFVYDSVQLLQMILDSIQHTLQNFFVDPELGDPQSLDLYFSLNGEDITLPDGVTVPFDQPYTGVMIVCK